MNSVCGFMDDGILKRVENLLCAVQSTKPGGVELGLMFSSSEQVLLCPSRHHGLIFRSSDNAGYHAVNRKDAALLDATVVEQRAVTTA
jgi:hypothetical protein